MSDHTIELTFRERQLIRALLIFEVADSARKATASKVAYPNRAQECLDLSYLAERLLGKFWEPVEGADADQLAREMDRQLCRLNVEYEGKRHSGRLGPIHVTVTAPGDLTRDEVRQLAAGGAGEQFKHKYLMTHVLQDGGL